MSESLEVTFENINEYLAGNTSKNSCGHTERNIVLDNFIKVGTLWDESCGGATWHSLRLEGSDGIMLGSFPYQGCDVYECKSCKQPILARFDGISGHVPFIEFYLVSSNDEFILDPVLNYFSISSDFTVAVGARFGIDELKSLDKIPSASAYESVEKLTITSIDEFQAVNVHRYQWKDTDNVNFELIAPRSLMREIQEFIDGLEQSA